MSGHTPGPWHAGEPLLIGRLLVRDETGDIVAEVLGFPSQSETEANARLIAAAPDLLAALRRLINIPIVGTFECYESARAALAKAEPAP